VLSSFRIQYGTCFFGIGPGDPKILPFTIYGTRGQIGTTMIIRDPEKNFEELWETFRHRYPFFELRKVDWRKQYDIHRPKVTSKTSDDELFDIMCQMLAPLEDGHVELKTKAGDNGEKRYFNAEKRPRFYQ